MFSMTFVVCKNKEKYEFWMLCSMSFWLYKTHTAKFIQQNSYKNSTKNSYFSQNGDHCFYYQWRVLQAVVKFVLETNRFKDEQYGY